MKRNRKKILLLILSFVLLWTAANSQSLGIKMYYNFARSQWEDPDSSDFREEYASKYALGPYLELRFIPYLSLSVEALFAKKGGIISSPDKKGEEYRLSYLSFPLLLNFYVIPVGPVQVFVSTGFEYSFLLMKELYDLDLESAVDQGTQAKFAKSDISYLIGFGLRLNIVITKLILEGRYSLGQKDIFLPQYLRPGESLKNRVISFGIGLAF